MARVHPARRGLRAPRAHILIFDLFRLCTAPATDEATHIAPNRDTCSYAPSVSQPSRCAKNRWLRTRASAASALAMRSSLARPLR